MTTTLRDTSLAPAAVVVFLSVALSVSVAAQVPGPSRVLTVAGGYATQLDHNGSFSLGASALRARSGRISLGIEGGYDQHEAFTEGGEFWWDGGNVTGSECPEPCTWQRVAMKRRYVTGTWHLGGVLRLNLSATPGAVVPTAELGLGLYGIRSSSAQRTEDATTGAPVPQLSGEGSSIEIAPGASGAFGVDVFPGNGRVGVGAVARLSGAALPTGEGLFARGFASLQARITLR